MTTTVADVVTDVKDRLNIAAAATYEFEPTDDMLTRWVLAAAKYATGQLQPPQELSGSVAADLSVAVTADIAYYVAREWEMLLAAEWAKRGNFVLVQPQKADPGDEVTVWYYKAPALATGTTSFDTTCIFGPDWLEELITMMVAEQVELRRSQTASSAADDDHAGMMRSLQDVREQLMTPYRQTLQEWHRQMESRLQQRSALGNMVFRDSAWFDFENESAIINPAAGIG